MSELCCGDCERQWRFSLHRLLLRCLTSCLCPGLWDERGAEAVGDLPPGGSAQRSRPPASGEESHCQHFKVPNVRKMQRSWMKQQDVTFESSFTELLCISKLYLSSSRLPPPSFYCHFILLISWSSILIYSELLFFCLLSCSVLSKLFSSAPVPFLKMSRTTPSWGSRTSCRWWATFPLRFIF